MQAFRQLHVAATGSYGLLNGAAFLCWVLPGLDSGPCLSGPVRPPRLVVVVFVIAGLPSARLAPEGSRLLSYLCVCIAYYRTCVHIRYVWPLP
jgi:hypothetical protein